MVTQIELAMSLGRFLWSYFFEAAAFFAALLVFAYRATTWDFIVGVGLIFLLLRILRRTTKRTINHDRKAVFITGCDTGFGYHLAERLATKTFKVFAGCLLIDGEGSKKLGAHESNRIQILPLDVTRDDSVQAALEFVQQNLDETELWGLVNNAGIYAHGEVELSIIDAFKKCAEVNLYGLIRVTKAFLPLIRKSKGRIVNMSSSSGLHSWPCSSPYNTSKYGVESVSDSLRAEMRRFDVKVILIEPAMFGGNTGIHNESNGRRYMQEIEEFWKTASTDVKQTYTKSYMLRQVKLILELRGKFAAKSTKPVIDAMEDGLTNTTPKFRYLVHGGPWPIDPIAVFAKVFPFVPEFLMDWIICRITMLNKLPSESIPKDEREVDQEQNLRANQQNLRNRSAEVNNVAFPYSSVLQEENKRKPH
ncbi:hypothetical protein CHS0354_001521 [Potamilus streckersoni]|uniref:Uncharacterized protein n=1 Tax=Potamilus streckersoni TaxID=2493646 RepID=A0AAE0RVJ5_9BIVA|nr:hypothetical protein CHS0354_001521 [Potamilus streckersoni]